MDNNSIISTTTISKGGNESTISTCAESITINASKINIRGIVMATKQVK